jgi:hypothetical protein
MPWTSSDYPNSMKNLDPKVRERAIHIANAILQEGGDEGMAIATGIKRAKMRPGLIKSAAIMSTQDVDAYHRAHHKSLPVGMGTATIGGMGLGALLGAGIVALATRGHSASAIEDGLITGGLLGTVAGGATGAMTNAIVGNSRLKKHYPELHDQAKRFREHGHDELAVRHELEYLNPVDAYATAKGLSRPSVLTAAGTMGGTALGLAAGLPVGLPWLGMAAGSSLGSRLGSSTRNLIEHEHPELLSKRMRYREELNNLERMGARY